MWYLYVWIFFFCTLNAVKEYIGCPYITRVDAISDPHIKNFIESTDLLSYACACPTKTPTEIADIIENAFIAYGMILKSQHDLTFAQAIAYKNAAIAKKDILYKAIFHNQPASFQQLVNMHICKQPQ